ncbi:Hypothetical_protein [Hexamita inflata]|uniref:Hypothetical_protein n=1 Tax=Hexamita inflata TaxID=28002 RepID=A0AA86UG21_9EUKA|nr:Hypothetical protein HINF_LOCUS37412 [Hexamita inflata]
MKQNKSALSSNSDIPGIINYTNRPTIQSTKLLISPKLAPLNSLCSKSFVNEQNNQQYRTANTKLLDEFLDQALSDSEDQEESNNIESKTIYRELKQQLMNNNKELQKWLNRASDLEVLIKSYIKSMDRCSMTLQNFQVRIK